MYYTYGVRFTWDPKKAAVNLRKHGVSFEEATSVFADPLALAVEDPIDPGRALLIGLSDRRRLLLSVYTEVDEERSGSSARVGQPRTRGDTMKKARSHEEPSRAALREMPEVDFRTAKVRRNPYAERIAAEGIVHVRPGKA